MVNRITAAAARADYLDPGTGLIFDNIGHGFTSAVASIYSRESKTAFRVGAEDLVSKSARSNLNWQAAEQDPSRLTPCLFFMIAPAPDPQYGAADEKLYPQWISVGVITDSLLPFASSIAARAPRFAPSAAGGRRRLF